MLFIEYTNKFKRDLKRAKKRNKPLHKLKQVMTLIAEQVTLDAQYHDHHLTGNWAHHRELHIQPDWLLIYKLTKNSVIFVRTGSHADLFNK